MHGSLKRTSWTDAGARAAHGGLRHISEMVPVQPMVCWMRGYCLDDGRLVCGRRSAGARRLARCVVLGGMSEVSRLVYLAALMINTGEDMVELMTEHESEMLGASVPEGNGFVVD